MIGNILRDREVQYTAVRDEITQTWRILDTWHDALRTIDPETEIEDDNEAVTILTEGEFIALIKEAGRIGVLANATFGTGEAEHEAKLLDKESEIVDLNRKIQDLEFELGKAASGATEAYKLKETAMDNIIKLVSMQDMANLGGE